MICLFMNLIPLDDEIGWPIGSQVVKQWCKIECLVLVDRFHTKHFYLHFFFAFEPCWILFGNAYLMCLKNAI